MTQAGASPEPRLGASGAALLGLLALAVLCAGSFGMHNHDVWLHARTGEWILEHGTVPSTNVLSELHRDHPSVHDKWLFQVAAHGALDGLGPGAVAALRILLMLLLAGVMAHMALALGAGPAATLFFVLLALLAGRARMAFRPDLVSMVLLVVFARVLLVSRPDGRGAARWLVPLQILWVNLHGYFLLGWLAALAVAAGRLVQRRFDAARRVALLALLLMAACLVNPAGLDGWLHPFALLADLRENRDFYRSAIVEFAPTFGADFRQPYDRLAFCLLAGTTAILLAWQAFAARQRARTGVPPSRLDGALLPAVALLVLLGVMVPSLRRNMASFAFVAAPLAAAAWSARVGVLVPGRILPLLLPVGLACAVSFGELSDAISVRDGSDRRAGFSPSRFSYPDEGIDFLARELPRAKVFTAFRYGSTFTGRRWPAQVASTNGNTDGYPTEYLREVMDATSGSDPLAFDLLVARHGHEAALIPMVSPLSAALLLRDDWTLVRLGVHEAVYVRRDGVDPLWLARHDLEAPLRAGRGLSVPRTPVSPPLFGLLPRVVDPRSEKDAAFLLLAAGFRGEALAAARLARETAPDDAEALALGGLLAPRGGLAEQQAARALLLRSLAAGRPNRLEAEVRRRLEELGEP